MSGENIIEVRGLRTQFGDHVVHDGLDLDVKRGEILGVVGGSGTGKSVLLREIVGLLRPAAGTIRVFGQDVGALSGAAREAVERRWGVMFQDGALFSSLTVRENVEVPLRAVPGLTDSQRQGLAELKVAMAGLPWNANAKFPSDLSGGMRKRAGLARALALDPEIVFLDEPTAGLDPIGADAFDRLIVALRDALNLSVFLVTHDLDTLHACCDRIAVLAEKKVLVTGTMAEMLKVDHPWVHEYFHGPRARAAQTTEEAGGQTADRGKG
ncbi:phospholipid/cholesterol/gamma-HCH transport system ATP-binding protein [Paracoccus alcaliphilus]|uniref:Phospholipid/cholesterol/gamma-HCH transport system ATP-binding protein n=1 Tax=Paracoccus alcaliphilus TaxID=34002 RepID=A0A1H8FQD4_9RHOB|nr:ABC transporter ATP-binding protein [Paracoccus alcaliphilus]WCR19409.1 ABC transporter ATP-binding protein [Paracoccus alcaliphilus]SEN33457.1 phospholipid/cholesterol/gamma-HCH transport system ATP-binding protein [Paracoccus alcaliphilus]